VLLAVFVIPAGGASPALATRLQARAHAMALQTSGPAGLDGTARYIAATLAAQGYRVHAQRETTGRHVVRKIEGWRSAPQSLQRPARTFILAGEDELAATVAMLELARLLKAMRPAAGTEIRFVFFLSRAVPVDAPFGSFVAYAGPRAALGHVGQSLAFFRSAPDQAAGALAAPAWVQGVTLGHLPGAAVGSEDAMLLADIGALHSPCLPATQDSGQPDYKGIARMIKQLALSIRVLAGVTES
jgi:hypothetical protein